MKRNYRYFIFTLIMLMAMVNYIDRGAISYASDHILSEYGFSKINWGAVLSYFGYGYIIGAVFGGLLSDRFGAKRIWFFSATAWSIFEIMTAFAGDIGLAIFGGSALAGFAAIRILFGISEGPAYSVINKSVANWATNKERAFVVSLGLLSTPLGSLLTAPIAVGILTLTNSWRLMFILLGIISLLLMIFFMCRFTNTPFTNHRVTEEERNYILKHQDHEKIKQQNEGYLPWYTFFQNKNLLLNAIGYFSFNYVNFLLLTWTPKYLQDEFHYNLSSLWYMAMIPWIGACFTVLIGGRVSDYLLKKTGNLKLARGKLAASALLMTTLSFIMVSQAGNIWTVIILMCIANAFNAFPNAIYWAVIIDSSPKSNIGTYSGLTHFIANMASFLAPLLTGYLTWLYGYSMMFVAAAVATGIGMTAMLFLTPGLAPVKSQSVESK